MEKLTIAAFDFDGTITTRDSLLPFLLFTHGFKNFLFKMVKISPKFLLYLLGKIDRQEIKEAIITEFYKNLSVTVFKNQAEKYALSSHLKKIVRSKAIKK